MASWFEYPITRNFTFRYFSPALIIVGGIWTIVVIVLSFAEVGYEYDIIYSTEFNKSEALWYEKIFPKTPLIPATRICQPAIVKVHDSQTRVFPC